MTRLLSIALLAATLGIGCFYAGHYTRTEKPVRPDVVFTKPLPPFGEYAVPVPTRDALFVICPADCRVSGFPIDKANRPNLRSLVVISKSGIVKLDHFDITVTGSPRYVSYGILMTDPVSATEVHNTSVWGNVP